MADTASKHIDMTTGSLWRNIPLFAFPVAATSILEQLSNLIATVIIGNFSGDQGTLAMAAVGSNVPLTSLMLNLFIGMSLGSNVVIANAIGRNDQNMVKRAVHTSILMALVGFVVIALGEIFAEPMLAALNVPAETMPLASLYLRVFLLSMPSILLYNFEAAIFRSIGDTKVPLAALAISGVLNVLLNLFFVIVLHMTVNGVAIATVAANAVSAALLYVRLTRTDKCVRVERKALRIDGASLKRILSIGLPAGVQSAVFSFANIVIQSAINTLGTVAIAASSAAFNVEILAYDVLNSFSQACTTFVGQNYGAGCHRDICLGRCPAAERKVAARHFQQRSRGHCHRLYSPCDDPAGVCFLPDLRNTLRVSARLRHFARARTFDDARRVRYPHRVGQVRLPDEHDVPDRHVGLSHQPWRDGGADPLRRADLPPVQTLCGP